MTRLTPKGLEVSLHGKRDGLHKPRQVLKLYFSWSMVLHPYFAQSIQKGKEKIKSYVTTVFRYS